MTSESKPCVRTKDPTEEPQVLHNHIEFRQLWDDLETRAEHFMLHTSSKLPDAAEACFRKPTRPKKLSPPKRSRPSARFSEDPPCPPNNEEFEKIWQDIMGRSERRLRCVTPKSPGVQQLATPTRTSQSVPWVPTRAEAEAEVIAIAKREMPWGPGKFFSAELRAQILRFRQPDKRGRVRYIFKGPDGESLPLSFSV